MKIFLCRSGILLTILLVSITYCPAQVDQSERGNARKQSKLKIDETIAKGYFLKGMCYKESGDTTRAISSFQTACEQDNQYYDAYVETGRLFAAKKIH